MLCAEGLRFYVGLRNSLLDEVALHASHPPFRQRLIVGSGTANVGMTLKNQVRIRLGFKILLEVGGHRHQNLLLAGQQSSVGILDRRHSRLEVDTVKRQTSFQSLVHRRWWRILDRNLGGSLSG